MLAKLKNDDLLGQKVGLVVGVLLGILVGLIVTDKADDDILEYLEEVEDGTAQD